MNYQDFYTPEEFDQFTDQISKLDMILNRDITDFLIHHYPSIEIYEIEFFIDGLIFFDTDQINKDSLMILIKDLPITRNMIEDLQTLIERTIKENQEPLPFTLEDIHHSIHFMTDESEQDTMILFDLIFKENERD